MSENPAEVEIPLYEAFAVQAARTPDAVAAIDGWDTASYAELERRAGHVAAALSEQDCAPGEAVGVRLRRGIDLVAALLGVWRAGGAYVPIDPDHPAERIAGIVEEAGCRIVLTDESVAKLSAAEGEPPSLDHRPPAPDRPAYLIYTSGSTGKPKGVVVTQRGIANRVWWTVRTHGLSERDRVLQKTSLSFDAAGWEIFAPLVSGGTVVLAPAGTERDPAAMVDAVIRDEVTVLQVVPSLLRLLVGQDRLAECTSLRLLFSAGEPLHAELCQQVWAKVPVELWNTYGPTECAIDVTAYRCDPGQTAGPVPIGAPITGAHVVVLDEHGELTPIGLTGELYLGGAGVGLGYVGQPELTAERFVPDPFGPPGSRLYRTGDRARWRSDGTLAYLGRLDDQVKVNGVRVEPGEVEAALRAHPAVRGGAVLAVPGPAGDLRLAAFVIGEIQPATLRTFLRGRLPEHLVPTLVVPVAELPMLTSGKVDRAALRAIELTEPPGRPGFRAPSTAAEQTVAEVWAELLEADQVGVDDDFFQLGGHSLLITRLAEVLRAKTGRHLEVRHLFAASTVGAQAALLMTKDIDVAPEQPARPAGRLPLSFGQRRLWFLEQLRRGDQEYVVPLFLRVPADIDPEIVQGALNGLAARHEVLRTRYVVQDNEPWQVIDPPAAVELRVVRGVPSKVALFRAELVRGFDLAEGPLWRALLLARPGLEGILLITAHHIAVDGQSLVVLAEEFERLCAGETDLPAPTLQYADHSVRQRHALTGRLLEEQLAYWREALAGLPLLELPVDRPRAAERDSDGAVLKFTLPPQIASALLEQGRTAGATPFMTLLTVFSVLLARYCRTWDVVVGTPVAGRTAPGSDRAVGFFLNSLVLRANLTPELSFTEALTRVRAVCVGAFGHADLPFERLVEEVQPSRDLSRTPVYQVIFDLHDGGLAEANTNVVDAQFMQSIWNVAKTDLTLIMRTHANGAVDGILEYATALFDQATITRLGANFVQLAESLATTPDTPIGVAELVAAPERELLLGSWNDTTAELPPVPVHVAIAEQAARTPDAVALKHDGGVVTYAELDAEANRFARVLRERGVTAGTTVGVLLGRGPDLVAALLGIWKAGGAQVPLDPSFPAGRVQHALADSGAAVLVSDLELVERSEGFAGGQVLVDRDRGELDRQPGEAPAALPGDGLDRLAYLIYTSGSTGTPKGVSVEHRGLANYLQWTVGAYAAYGTGGAPLFTSVAFDLGLPNLYTPLLTGQPVRLFPQDFDLTGLGAALAEAGPFSFVKLAPAQLELILGQLADAGPAPLAELVCAAGDWVPAALAERWRAVTGRPGARFAAEYGPTEITVGNSALFPEPGEPPHEFLSIGRPIPNTTMHVLDEQLNVVPVGVVGEIHVGGVGVARGYAGRTALTAEKFLPDPYGAAGTRLYRTGDLGRVLPDGQVEFRGRADNQVKVRGYRVELGSVEAALLAHPEVREAVVVLNGQQLVAYHVGGADDLAAFVAQSLPRHEVPGLFVPMTALPLTTNGKVDRRALPAPEASAPAGPDRKAPSTVAERRIAAIWARVFDRRIGVHDNFFDLGGHSLTAATVMSMLRQEFGLDIGMHTLFDAPTVAGLAEAVEARIRAEIDGLSAAEVRARGEETQR
ncbi:non-ribosomal peptide synthetase [Amycolatopsis sp. PS_44_ISF1]|uniref:non-ribosomal peptide synthetase n=1 Tax=Amycolatopsis sp. PS_44_ISF1 TaxID=2974917 RepID=UPI0028DF6687|nr:non-ribosomal peptide synthetase [Amycolatopsis sp. PS_44_ISF1]MDT8913883.1 amino acid adenylation domain-containing protein [Amycolatopsis sp. PS_44_ISF1]